MLHLRCKTCLERVQNTELARVTPDTKGTVELKCKKCKAIVSFLLTGQAEADKMVVYK